MPPASESEYGHLHGTVVNVSNEHGEAEWLERKAGAVEKSMSEVVDELIRQEMRNPRLDMPSNYYTGMDDSRGGEG